MSVDLEAFGYRQELKRSLSWFDLLVYGLVFISPIGPWSPFGFVFNSSHGMVPLVYLVGVLAMMLTAASYVAMSAAFPVAGSVYCYAGRGICEAAGFLAGWALLLDYLLLPTLIYVACAVAVHAVVPWFPMPLVVIAGLSLNTLINLAGIESTARLSLVLLVIQLILVSIFIILGILALIHGSAGAHLSLQPFYNETTFSLNALFGALSLAVLSFLGFDAVSTLSEEAEGGPRAVGRATVVSLLLAGALFVAQTYIASLFALDRQAFPPGNQTDTAFYIICKMLGGEVFEMVVSLFGVLASGLAVALAAQAATGRLLFSMARDRKLPSLLAHVSARHQIPDRAIVLVASITLVLGVTLVDKLELLTSMVNFGALMGFLALHVSVVVHFIYKKRSKKWIVHGLIPLAGACFIAFVLFNAQSNARFLGMCWMVIGIGWLLFVSSSRKASLLDA